MPFAGVVRCLRDLGPLHAIWVVGGALLLAGVLAKDNLGGHILSIQTAVTVVPLVFGLFLVVFGLLGVLPGLRKEERFQALWESKGSIVYFFCFLTGFCFLHWTGIFALVGCIALVMFSQGPTQQQAERES